MALGVGTRLCPFCSTSQQLYLHPVQDEEPSPALRVSQLNRSTPPLPCPGPGKSSHGWEGTDNTCHWGSVTSFN